MAFSSTSKDQIVLQLRQFDEDPSAPISFRLVPRAGCTRSKGRLPRIDVHPFGLFRAAWIFNRVQDEPWPTICPDPNKPASFKGPGTGRKHFVALGGTAELAHGGMFSREPSSWRSICS